MILINIVKAKIIAHELRRIRRDKEFAPLDELISKQIPGKPFSEVEAARQLVRDKYANYQDSINNAENVDDLLKIVNSFMER